MIKEKWPTKSTTEKSGIRFLTTHFFFRISSVYRKDDRVCKNLRIPKGFKTNMASLTSFGVGT